MWTFGSDWVLNAEISCVKLGESLPSLKPAFLLWKMGVIILTLLDSLKEGMTLCKAQDQPPAD